MEDVNDNLCLNTLIRVQEYHVAFPVILLLFAFTLPVADPITKQMQASLFMQVCLLPE